MHDDIRWLDATAQAELVRQGEITPLELVDAAIERIEKLDPELNAVIHRQFDKARDDAAKLAREPSDAPFRGVPFLLKDVLCHEAGQPYSCGMQVLKEAGWTESTDTWLVERFRSAGFVTLGRTNAPELASSITTEPVAYGATHNPWDTNRSPGGSSGGAAAAVASGMVPVAHGNDMGGSIRFPAHCCGLVGLKPTRARTTLGPDHGEFWGPTTHEHVLTRTVRDTAAVLDRTAGPGVGDPYTAPPPARPFAAEVGVEPGRLRIGMRTALTDGTEAHPECIAAVQNTARLLEGLGHDVVADVPAALDDAEFGQAVAPLFGTVVARDIDRWSERLGRTIELDEIEPMNALLAEIGRGVTGAGFLAALEAIQRWSRAMASWWAGGFDVLLLPTSPEPPVPLGRLAPTTGDPFALLMDVTRLITFTAPFNMTGQPAVSLPLHWTADGLPVGVQFAAAYGREDILLRLAGQLEQARPWADRRPPV